MRKETVTQDQEEQRIPYRINQRETYWRHSISKMTKLEENTKSNKGKIINNIQREISHSPQQNYSGEILQGRGVA